MTEILPFPTPIYVTRPVLPKLEKYQAKLAEIWESRQLTNMGRQHNLLEERLAAFLGTPHLSLYNNGTIALLAACRALDLEGEVITTPFTFPATLHALEWNRLTPVFCDIDPVTMNVDPYIIESLITSKTTAILGVHVFGVPCAVREIQAIAEHYQLKVIYDAAHAFGLKIDNKDISSFGDISMFSFHATKLFHSAEGGALAFRDPALVDKIYLLKNFGIADEETVCLSGINGKLSELHAALGLLVLDEIEAEWNRRQQLDRLYRAELSGIPGLDILPPVSGSRPSLQYFPVRISAPEFGISRDQLHQQLKAYNVFARKYFYPLACDYPVYQHLPAVALPVARRVASEILCLPFYGGLDLDDAAIICQLIRYFAQGGFHA